MKASLPNVYWMTAAQSVAFSPAFFTATMESQWTHGQLCKLLANNELWINFVMYTSTVLVPFRRVSDIAGTTGLRHPLQSWYDRMIQWIHEKEGEHTQILNHSTWIGAISHGDPLPPSSMAFGSAELNHFRLSRQPTHGPKLRARCRPSSAPRNSRRPYSFSFGRKNWTQIMSRKPDIEDGVLK